MLLRPLLLSLCLWLFAVGCNAHAQGVPQAASAQKTPDASVEQASGFWRTQGGDGVIELYSCEDKLCGRIHWQRADSDHLVFDIHNPDKDRHDDPLCGKQILDGFTPNADGALKGGMIYNPRDGSRYHAEIRLKDTDTLLLRGYVLAPLLGQTQTWTRTDDLAVCSVPEQAPAHD